MPKEKVIKKSALVPTALIAGGAGFLGSHLAETLLLKDTRVVVLDNFKTGKDVYVNALLENPKFALFDVDINQGIPKTIHSVDYIFHLASVESYLYSQNDINLDSLLTNALGTKHLLDLANKSSAKFLLASSLNVYQGLISPLSLEHYFGNTVEEEKQYSLSEAKRFAEALVWEYYKRNQTDVRIVRLPEVYGPKMNLASSGNLGRLLKQLLENQNLTVFGDGIEKEYYMYISDAISGIVKALFNNETEGKIYTLVPKEPHAVLETTYLLKSLADRELQVEFKKTTDQIKANEPILPDKTNLENLKWEPKVSFKDGLVKTAKWFGYEVNEHTFKPAKLIDKKMEEKKTVGQSKISSLQKPVTVETPRKPNRKLRLLAVNFLKKLKPPKPAAAMTIAEIKDSKFLGSKLSYVAAIITALLVTLVMFAGTPLLQTYKHSKNAQAYLEEYPTLIAHLNYTDAKVAANKAFQELNKTKTTFKRVKWLFTITGKSDTYDKVIKTLSSMTYFSKTAYDIADAAIPFTNLWEVIRPDSTSTLDEESFVRAQTDFNSAQSNLQLALAEYKQIDPTGLPEKYSTKILDYGAILAHTSKGLELATAMAADIPNLLGIQEPKKYLILLQNSNELRPTGGFIGSYAVIELDKGKIKNLVIDDIYNPDGQIDVRGIEVASPAPIAQFLEEPNLHIRNANFNPDFSESVKAIEDLFFKINGTEFDGVFAIDLYFAKGLLNVTGPLFLTAYNEEITSENLYEKTQFYSEFNYEDGISQKKSFLTILGSKLLERLFALSSEDMPSLLTELNTALDEKHLLINLPASAFTSLLEKYSWDGNLVNTLDDYLYVVNSNLGGNKANYFVVNDMKYTVSSVTRDGVLRGEVVLKYTHTGEDYAWPNGAYTNYVRVLTQPGSKLTGAKLIFDDGIEQDLFDQMAIAKVKNYNSFETSIVVEPKQTATLTILYDLPLTLALTKENTFYSLYWQKQPGTQDDTYKFTFDAPFGLAVVETVPPATAKGQTVEFNGMLNKDTSFRIDLD